MGQTCSPQPCETLIKIKQKIKRKALQAGLKGGLFPLTVTLFLYNKQYLGTRFKARFF